MMSSAPGKEWHVARQLHSIRSLRKALTMNPASVALLVVALGLLTPACAEDYEDLDKLVATLPKDAAAVVKRRLECDHWAGEEPYDNARAREIARAIRRNKCSSLATDEAATLKRYPNNPKVVKAVNDAKALGEP
jgi:hypothetical protein